MTPHPALTLEIILDNIFGYADYRSRTVAARTCKDWHEPATNNIWRNLDSLLPLLLLLSPILWGPYQGDFAEGTRPDGWSAFLRVSGRVRSLKYEDRSPDRWAPHGDRYLSKDIFLRLALQRPHRELLPNLVELEWLDSRSEALDFLTMFVSSRTERITIVMGDTIAPPSDQIRFLIRHLPLFTRALSSFTLSTVLEASLVQDELIAMIGEMTGLKKIMLPRHYHTKEITEALGSHPSIDCILHSVDWNAHPPYEDEGNMFSFQPGWFVNLTRLSLDTNLGNVITLLKNSSRPPKLYSLKVSALRIPIDMEELRVLLKEIPEAYPNLSRLLFDFFHLPPTVPEETGSPTRIPFDIIRPLLSCSQMQTFRIGHNYPLDVTEEDILDLTKSWPKLVNLYFGEDPLITPDMAPGLPMRVLSYFASNCRRLQIVHLYMDTSTWRSFKRSSSESVPKFNSNLEWICFGTSPVDDDFELAVLLSEMCDHGPVEIGYGRGPFNVASQGRLVDDPRFDIWPDVNKQFKTLYRYRKVLETRVKDSDWVHGEQVDDLEAEVAGLRIGTNQAEV